jgi:hypothetical protein
MNYYYTTNRMKSQELFLPRDKIPLPTGSPRAEGLFRLGEWGVRDSPSVHLGTVLFQPSVKGF